MPTVRKWVDRYQQERGVQRKFGPGRPRSTTDQQDAQIVQHMRANPFSSAKKAAAENNVQYQTTLRRLNEGGLQNHSAAREIDLTEAHKQQRIRYCQSMLDVFGEENFKDIIFSDEKPFKSDENHHVRVWRPKGQRYNQNFVCKDRQSGHVSASYWGWISIAGPGEIVPTGKKFNSRAYVELLDKVGFPSIEAQFESVENIFFMQDNARIHTANIVRDYLAERHIRVLNHPPKSPDLNPIENIWAIMEKDRSPLIQRTEAGLNAHVLNRWESLRDRPDIFENLYNSLEKRFRYVIAHDGNIYHDK